MIPGYNPYSRILFLSWASEEMLVKRRTRRRKAVG
jgi:hypothetical protein